MAITYNPAGQLFTAQDIQVVASVKLLGSDKVLAKAIRDEMIRVLNQNLFRASTNIDKRVKKVVAQKLRETREYESLMGMGLRSLRGHFGISNPGDVEFVIEYVAEMIDVEITRSKSRSGEITLGIKFIANLQQMVDDMKVMGIGMQTTEKGEDLPWLQWLLFEGGKRIIKEHFVLFKSGVGRSGQAIMVKSKQKRWGVPLEFQGTKGNNWITRTLIDSLDDIGPIIEGEFNKVM